MIKLGDRVKMTHAHHAMNPRLRDKVGKVGTTVSVGGGHRGDEVLVEFGSVFRQWWLRERYLEVVP